MVKKVSSADEAKKSTDQTVGNVIVDATQLKQKSTKKTTTGKKMVKKAKKPSSEDTEMELYGTSRVNIPGASWQTVSLKNMSFADVQKLGGLVSIQVTDGSNISKLYKGGAAFQNDDAKKKYLEEQKKIEEAAKNKKRKTPVEEKKADAAVEEKKTKKTKADTTKKAAQETSVALPTKKRNDGKGKVNTSVPTKQVEEEGEEEEEDMEEDEDDIVFDEDEEEDDLDYDMLAEAAGLGGEGDWGEAEGDEEEGEGDMMSFYGGEGDMMYGMEGDEGDMMFFGEGDDMMMEGDEDEELFFEDEDEDEMEFEEVTEVPAVVADKVATAPKTETPKRVETKQEEQPQKLTKAQKKAKAAAAKAAAEPVNDEDIDPAEFDPTYASSPAAAFFHRNRDYLAWLPYDLHPLLLKGLQAKGFTTPTPIQAECLLPAMRDWKDVVGAAQTGSGKTLAFGLPILQAVLEQRAQRGEEDLYALKQANKGQGLHFNDPLTGLILTPTRELAVQIVDSLNAVAKQAFIRAVAVVGGLAQQKQDRLLSQCPSIVVATPGRLWEMISKGAKPFDDLTCLRFFVLDEADRMVANGQFPELESIIAYVQSFRDDQAKLIEQQEIEEVERRADDRAMRNRDLVAVDEKGNEIRSLKEWKAYEKKQALAKARTQEMGNEDEDAEEDEDDEEEAMDDIIIEDKSGLFTAADFEEEPLEEEEDNEEDNQDEDAEEDEEEDAEEDEEEDEGEVMTVIETPKPKIKRMQIFLFSATLTIQDDARGNRREFLKRSKRARASGAEEEAPDAAPTAGKAMLKELAHRLPFEKPHIVDFSSQYILAPGLAQVVMDCMEEDRDAHLYSQLYPHQGRCIIFANAIQVVKRLTNVLRALEFDAFPLHAHMQQNQRLSVIDKLKSPKHPNAIIIATDVAARGIDIPSVELVIQYHVPHDPETYVHRAGRTARAGLTGKNILLVTPKEQPEYRRLVHVLGVAGLEMMIQRPNSKYLQHLKRRWKLAQEIAQFEEKSNQEAKMNKWMRDQADACGLDMDEYDGAASLRERKVKATMSAKDKRSVGKHNKVLNNLNASRKRGDDDDDFSEVVLASKRNMVELKKKEQELKFLLREKIWTKGNYFY